SLNPPCVKSQSDLFNGARVAHLGSSRELAPYSRLALAHALSQRSTLTLSSRQQGDDKRRRYLHQAEQEMHVAAVGSAFRRLGSIGSPHLAQVPYVPSDIRFRAASI